MSWNETKGSGFLNDAEYFSALADGKINGSVISALSAGVVDDLDIADGKVDLWDNPNKTNIVDLNTNTSLEIVSNNASDIGALFLVFMLKDDGNGNWVQVSEVVVSNGTSPIALVNTAERVFFCAYIGGGPNEGTFEIRPIGSPSDVQLYMLPNATISRKGIISVPTNTTYFPELFSFAIARSTSGGGGVKNGEIYILGRSFDVEPVYQELFSFGLNTSGTSLVNIDTPPFFKTGFPGSKKRELKFQALTDNNNTKIWSTVFSYQKITGS
jgi:hypothetical protein